MAKIKQGYKVMLEKRKEEKEAAEELLYMVRAADSAVRCNRCKRCN